MERISDKPNAAVQSQNVSSSDSNKNPESITFTLKPGQSKQIGKAKIKYMNSYAPARVHVKITGAKEGNTEEIEIGAYGGVVNDALPFTTNGETYHLILDGTKGKTATFKAIHRGDPIPKKTVTVKAGSYVILGGVAVRCEQVSNHSAHLGIAFADEGNTDTVIEIGKGKDQGLRFKYLGKNYTLKLDNTNTESHTARIYVTQK